MSSGNFGRTCRDGIFGNLNIKGKNVIDENTNLNVKNGTVNQETKFKKNVIVTGNVFVKGNLQYN